MSDITDLLYYKKMKDIDKTLTPIVNELDKFSKFLYDNTNKSELWDLLMKVEEVRVQFYCELMEAKKIIAFSENKRKGRK